MKNLRLLLLTAALLAMAAVSSYAQISQGGTPASFQRATKAAVPTVTMASVDTQKLLAEDAQQEKLGIPYRFGYPFDVQYDLNNSGVWEELPDGTKLWRLRISCPGAYSINLIFDKFDLPDGAKLYVYNEDHSDVIGAFTSANNKPYHKFATAPVKGDVSILEYTVPANVGNPGELRISRIVHAYKNVFFDHDVAKQALNFGGSGSCNNNVHCPVGAPWADQIRSVAMITTSGGFRLCSGALVNNVRQDFTPYFLTANHCLGGEETWVFIFNYESPECLNIDGPTNMSISGSTLLATSTYSDFALLQLSANPPDSYNVYYAGWSAVDVAPQNGTCIHHPEGDIKKISFDYDPETSADYLAASGTTHWRIGSWDDGTTEPGSSGSPLFDQNHHIVGQLHGGYAACNSLTSDWFGKFAKSWSHGTTSDTRIKDWLDPDNTGLTILDGIDQNGLTISADIASGWEPLSVHFSGSSRYTADSWTWDFGDGDSDYVQTPVHTYTIPGPHTVTVQITSDTSTYTHTSQNLIKVFADTLVADSVEGGPNDQIMISIYGRNNFPTGTIRIPVEYGGPASLTFDSLSTVGCRTNYFTVKNFAHYDPFNSRLTVKLQNATDNSVAELPAGSGLVAKLYFHIGSSAISGQASPILLDGYLTYLPEYDGSIVNFNPAYVSGKVSVGGCCIGIRGNVDGDSGNAIDIADVIYLVDYSFGNGPAPSCTEEADVNADGGIDVSDLIYLVDYSFGSGPAPLACP